MAVKIAMPSASADAGPDMPSSDIDMATTTFVISGSYPVRAPHAPSRLLVGADRRVSTSAEESPNRGSPTGAASADGPLGETGGQRNGSRGRCDCRLRPAPGTGCQARGDHTAWMPRSRRTNDMTGASTPYVAAPQADATVLTGPVGRQIVQGPEIPGPGRQVTRKWRSRRPELADGRQPPQTARKPPLAFLLTEFGQQHRPPRLERRDLSPELLQFTVDTPQFGPRLLFPQVALTVPGADQILDLTPEQPQPPIPVYLAGPVLELARTNRRDDLVLRQPELRLGRLVTQRRTLAHPFFGVEFYGQ
jgi:hypothetical protein